MPGTARRRRLCGWGGLRGGRGRAFWDQQIAADIQDHYKRWKDHADYEKWTTDPFRRSVVLGAPRRGGTVRPADQENPRR